MPRTTSPKNGLTATPASRRWLGRASGADPGSPEGPRGRSCRRELTARHAEIPAWDDMPAELKPVLEREMEVYAGFLEHVDHHVGRIVDIIEDLGILDDTIIYYIIGDNGASAEGTLNGAFNEMANFNGMAALETPEFLLSKMDELGSPSSYNHYAVGWARANCAPFQWTKQVASHWGGTRNGTIVHWPNGIDERGGLRSQFTHVIDIAPTILEAAGLPEPTMVNGVQQSPIEGTSMLYSFKDADADERHDLQYFEMFGNRSIYHRGWSAVTKHRTPWVMTGARPPLDDDVWELYDGNSDCSQARDLATEQPERLARYSHARQRHRSAVCVGPGPASRFRPWISWRTSSPTCSAAASIGLEEVAAPSPAGRGPR
jgi:arylsulfatase A-like enzyme